MAARIDDTKISDTFVFFFMTFAARGARRRSATRPFQRTVFPADGCVIVPEEAATDEATSRDSKAQGPK